MTPRSPVIGFEGVERAELAHDDDWWRLYEASFPDAEREPREVILRSLDAGVGVAIRARAEGRTVGLATLHLLRDPPAVFLVYLAVDAGCRSMGVGGALFEEAGRIGAARYPRPPVLVWEVDHPAHGERGPCERRIAFFGRHGGRVIPRAYVQPPVDGTRNGVPMLLMCRPPAGEEGPDHAAVERLVGGIYFEKYGAINGVPAGLLESLLEGGGT